MMRKAFTGIMILAICMQTGGRAFLYFWYQVGNGSFEKAFCINIDRPEMNCNGKCYLSKLLKQQREEERKEIPNPNSEEERFRTVYFSGNTNTDNTALVFYTTLSPTFQRENLHGRLFSPAIFHPPRTV